MISENSLNALIRALDKRVQAEHPVQLWLRDDDAVGPSQPLDRLLELTHRYGIPLTLAVIPMDTGKSLVDRLHDTLHVSVAVHGWSHQNYAPVTEKNQELGAHRELALVVAELQNGFSTLFALHTSRFVPLLVPPWNRIDSAVVAALAGIGFQALSTFGSASNAPVKMLNTHLDIIDWKGSRGGRDPDSLADELTTLVQEGVQPIGILTHHLVHDEKAWHFLETLMDATSGHEAVKWMDCRELM